MTEGTPALVAQLDIIEWLEKDIVKPWLEWFWETYTGKGKAASKEHILAAAKQINTAETVFVSREMCDVIEKAAKEMPDVPLQHENLFWQNAFIYFERPIQFEFELSPTDEDKRREREGIPEDVELVVDVLDEEDSPIPMRAIHFCHQPKVGQSETVHNERVEFKPGAMHVLYVDSDEVSIPHEEIGIGIFPIDFSAWTYGKPWKTVALGGSEFGSKIDEGLAIQRKLLLAVNLISAQYISLVSGQRAVRQQRRRAERMGVTTSPDYGDITYVTLRRSRQRSKGAGSEESDFEYSHRFPVSGHWRHQWYPSREEHELIWIDPYIKGPEEKPLIIKDKVYKVVR